MAEKTNITISFWLGSGNLNRPAVVAVKEQARDIFERHKGSLKRAGVSASSRDEYYKISFRLTCVSINGVRVAAVRHRMSQSVWYRKTRWT